MSDRPQDPRHRRGLELMNEIDPADGQRMLDEFAGIAPDLGRFLIEFVFADIYSRSVLSLRERQFVRLAALAAMGIGDAPMRANINSALNVGLEVSDIAETFIQCLPYAGFPRVIVAVEQLKAIVEERADRD
ncbi:carboxymuconolactone decarboxylase family protein [Streptosporangium saharense]|uniref:carboxymuconolactone decarboxylase family protein n=1 Tax=Streptosporangium saharense TaxID=1706840 RepID=UPI003318CF7C